MKEKFYLNLVYYMSTMDNLSNASYNIFDYNTFSVPKNYLRYRENSF